MRLIDAERLRNDDSMCVGVICDECPFADKLRSRCSFVDCVDRQPTIDTVKHGEWVEELDRRFHWHCSECGYVIGVIKMDCNYCPNCGTKMDGDISE